MRRLIRLCLVARSLGLAPTYVRRIAADQGREPQSRRYSPEIHQRFPTFFKDGKEWVTTEQTFNAHMRNRENTWMPSL